MRWLEGFERCAELAARRARHLLVYVADREMRYPRIMVRARRQPQIDWLIRATHNRCLAEGDHRWDRLALALVLGECAHPPGRPGRPGRSVVLTVRDRTGHAAPERRRTCDGDRAASPGRIPAGRGRAARLAFVEQPAGRHPRPSD